ncbi:F-box/kelch-repeat protein At3g23880-like [Cornus florida]|uniref:F-box/kelch-repeat protein At3g23880-like n=1 Tax=Cornus florida TaxID=4283 RepID=UPI0028964774|nr:F-box/kelch-repeat protein At3g23880-like [Cornus florida]
MASSSGDQHIPEDLIIEIVSRLPIKSLIRFRCVCKYWFGLIRTSTFVSKHLHHPNNKSCLLVHHYNYSTQKYVFAVFPDETLAKMPFAHNDIDEFQLPDLPDAIIGPISGIFCLFTHWEDRYIVVLWNPATKEWRSLAIPNPNLPTHIMDFLHMFGCGLDPITNDYKLIWIRYYYDEEEDIPYIPRVVSVYNLRTDSWRLFEFEMMTNSSINNSLCNTYLNGFYYWLTSIDFHRYTLLSFDMSKEIFKEDIPAPTGVQKDLCGDLTMYNDSIAMIYFDAQEVEKYFHVWVMKEEGFWTKQLNIGPLPEIQRPLGIWKNGELFLEDSDSQLVMYDHNTQEIKSLGLRGYRSCFVIVLYKESLFSVKEVDGCEKANNSS